MKPEPLVMTKQDRLATWEEISRATVTTPDRIMEQFYKNGTHFEAGSEWGIKIRYPVQEFDFFSYLSEINDADAN